MNPRSANAFAVGHLLVPAVLLLFMFSEGQYLLLTPAALSLLFALFLIRKAYVSRNLDQWFHLPGLALLVFIELALVALVYVLPDWQHGQEPVWLLFFWLPLYAAALDFRASLLVSALAVVETALLTIAIGGQFTASGNIMIVLGVLAVVLLLGRASGQLVQVVFYDSLTGLPNRVLFKQRLHHALSKRNARTKGLSVLFLDLDQFKQVNDTMGHEIGDLLLKTIADRLRACLPSDIVLARLGGDEFALLAPNRANAEAAGKLCGSVFECLRDSILLGQHEIFTTTSIGIAFYPSQGATAEALMKNAEAAMYRAKQQGRNNYQFYLAPERSDSQIERFAMEVMLRKALEKDELLVYYQPRIDTKTEQVVCVEALVRWQHPSLGLIPPQDFIPLAEETGLIVQLGEQVLRKACMQVKQWQNEGLKQLSVSVNLSPLQFRQQHLPSVIGRILRQSGLAPASLELEITESAAMHNVTRTILMLRELKEMGVNISIDDFGTGYSSLSYLKKFPIDALKVDRSFTSGIHEDPDNAAIVNAIIALAKILKLTVTAEGVETEAQYLYLRQHNCDEVQGYLFGKPMPAHTFEEWYALRTSDSSLMLSHEP